MIEFPDRACRKRTAQPLRPGNMRTMPFAIMVLEGCAPAWNLCPARIARQTAMRPHEINNPILEKDATVKSPGRDFRMDREKGRSGKSGRVFSLSNRRKVTGCGLSQVAEKPVMTWR